METDRDANPSMMPESATPSGLGKYELFASLGRGGMAEVFLAVARGPAGFNKLTVVKRLRAALADDPVFLGMFLDEARLAARLNHPNVVHTYEVGEFDGSYFIAMEYLEGQPLNKVIREAERLGPIPPPVCARIVADALLGLHHAHELRDYDGQPLSIIHRDVSPHNVFVTYEGVVKLVDFGIAKAALSSTQTEVGVLKGKLAYMAPEQAAGSPMDRRADLFAMGIVLWELLTCKKLMGSDSAPATLNKLLHEPIPRAANVLPGLDPRLDEIVGCALDRDPARRFQSALHMREALEAWLASTGRTVRQEDVGQLLGSMFHSVREQAKLQVQAQMAALATADAASGRIGRGSELYAYEVATGSGSGIVPVTPLPPLGGQPLAFVPEELAVAAQRYRRTRERLIALLVGLLLALGVVTVLIAHYITAPRRPLFTHPSARTSAATPPQSASGRDVAPTPPPTVSVLELRPAPPGVSAGADGGV